MTAGKDPTLIGLSAWLVAVWIGVTMPGLLGAEPKTTQAVWPRSFRTGSGSWAGCNG
jgi:hypothetical protein